MPLPAVVDADRLDAELRRLPHQRADRRIEAGRVAAAGEHANPLNRHGYASFFIVVGRIVCKVSNSDLSYAQAKPAPRYIEGAWLPREPRPSARPSHLVPMPVMQPAKPMPPPMPAHELAGLVERAREGDVAAFERLIASVSIEGLHLRVRLHRLARCRAGSGAGRAGEGLQLARQLPLPVGVLDVALLDRQEHLPRRGQVARRPRARARGAADGARRRRVARSRPPPRSACWPRSRAARCCARCARCRSPIAPSSRSPTCRGSATKRLPARSACRSER